MLDYIICYGKICVYTLHLQVLLLYIVAEKMCQVYRGKWKRESTRQAPVSDHTSLPSALMQHIKFVTSSTPHSISRSLFSWSLPYRNFHRKKNKQKNNPSTDYGLRVETVYIKHESVRSGTDMERGLGRAVSYNLYWSLATYRTEKGCVTQLSSNRGNRNTHTLYITSMFTFIRVVVYVYHSEYGR